jgi:dihydroxy-acid dehydratase
MRGGFPTISLGEVFLNPTSMMFRNLMAMDTEEMIRAQPMDAVVLIGGCDKTVPAQLMGALSANMPAIQLVTGPCHRPAQGRAAGACTDCRRFWASIRAGNRLRRDRERRRPLGGDRGTCAVMGTASTWPASPRLWGLRLPGRRRIPRCIPPAGGGGSRAAPPWRWHAIAITPRQIITEKSVENALRVLMAVGGSTNAMIHLTAVAGRAGIKISYDLLNAYRTRRRCWWTSSRRGRLYGGFLRRRRRRRGAAGTQAVAASRHAGCRGRTLGEAGGKLDWVDRKVIREFANPVSAVGG